MKRKASAQWVGGLKDGHGTVTTESGVLADTPYSFKTRFEAGAGTNPEELIGAAHAGCFTMALSAQLEKAGFKADELKTSAVVTLEQADGGFLIPAIHLNVVARIPKIEQAAFEAIAHEAKVGCPVSKLFKATITLDAALTH